MKYLVQWLVFAASFCLGPMAAWAGPPLGTPPLKPVLVFDLDRTLLDPSARVTAINRSVGYPGSAQEYSDRKTRHGHRFLLDPRYLIWDRPFEGSADFVARAQKELDADILYLSGRIKEQMWDGTVDQLRRGGFPGYGVRSHLRNRVSLWLKPEAETRPTADFKVQLLSRIAPPWRVAMIVEDSSKNLGAFEAAGYSAQNRVFLVQVGRDIPPVLPNPVSRTWIGGYHSAEDQKKLNTLLEKAKGCSQLLLEPYFRKD